MDYDYLSINRKLWNDKTSVHLTSEFYDVAGFKKSKNSLNAIEINALGNVAGKSLLHLQCHFGMDSMSWAGLGASVTGIDLSDEAIKQADLLSKDLNIPARFICSDVYSLRENLTGQFDIVFTSYGTIGWLPDLNKWASVISHFLKPGGIFYIVDFHPVLWMMDNEFTKIEYSYFNVAPIVEEIVGTYADFNALIKNTSVGWNHPLSEIFSALINAGLQIEMFNEFDYSVYNCFKNTVEFEKGKFRIKGLEGVLPIMYEIKCQKPL